jgi:uncharacterized oxidoreductase
MKPNIVAITGANRGLGEALVIEGLAAGWEVVACVRDVESALPELRRHPRVHAVECDLRKPEDVSGLAQRLNDAFPGLRGLINNAAVQYSYPVLEGANFTQQLEDEIRVNLTSPLQLGHELMPLLSRNEGFIANVSSALAYVPKARSPVYAATKAALSLYTRSARLQSPGVRMTEIVLPLVDTDMTRGRGNPKRKLSPREAARCIVTRLEQRPNRILIGVTRLVPWLLRLLPEAVVIRIINRSDALPRALASNGSALPE